MVAWNNEDVCAFYCIIIEYVLVEIYFLFLHVLSEYRHENREPYHLNHVIPRLGIYSEK